MSTFSRKIVDNRLHWIRLVNTCVFGKEQSYETQLKLTIVKSSNDILCDDI